MDSKEASCYGKEAKHILQHWGGKMPGMVKNEQEAKWAEIELSWWRIANNEAVEIVMMVPTGPWFFFGEEWKGTTAF